MFSICCGEGGGKCAHCQPSCRAPPHCSSPPGATSPLLYPAPGPSLCSRMPCCTHPSSYRYLTHSHVLLQVPSAGALAMLHDALLHSPVLLQVPYTITRPPTGTQRRGPRHAPGCPAALTRPPTGTLHTHPSSYRYLTLAVGHHAGLD